jgi:hypothetical protein
VDLCLVGHVEEEGTLHWSTTTAVTAAPTTYTPIVSPIRRSLLRFVTVVVNSSTRVGALRVSEVGVGNASKDMSSLPTGSHTTVSHDREGSPVTFQRSVKLSCKKGLEMKYDCHYEA